jgi:four helix bundle protein
VYQLALEAAIEIYQISKSFPKEEQFSLTVQIRKASRSVCTCIGEGWGKRKYPKHFSSKLTDAVSESYETKVWLDIALRHEFINRETWERLDGKYEHIGAKLYKMVENAESWCSSRATF